MAIRSHLDEAVAYIERIAACTALLIGAIAVLHFADKVFPLAPIVAMVAGGLLFFLAYFLVVWVFVTSTATLFRSIKRDWLAVPAALLAFLCTLFFFIASAFAAFAALTD